MRYLLRTNLVGSVFALGLLAFGLLGWQIDSQRAEANQRIPPTATHTGLITHVFQSDDRATRIIVVDTVQRRVAVYFVSQESGEIQLKSVRNIMADLSMQEFNSGDPSPLDIQKLKERN